MIVGTALLALVASCATAPLPPRPAPRVVAPPKPAPPPPAEPPIDRAEVDAQVRARLKVPSTFAGPWKPTLEGAEYLAPDAVVADDGAVDVVVHFHGAKVVNKEWRATGIDAVVISATYPGYGVNVYRTAFADPSRFGAIVDDVVSKVGATRVRRLGLVSWSAGYGGTQQVLSDPKWYPLVDTVVLLDGLHVDYVEGLVDDRGIAVFLRFARDAMKGSKLMVITHSAVQPPGYASTTETASYVLSKLGVAKVEQTRSVERGMTEWYHADEGDFHVRGYRGDGPHDHMDQVTLVDDVVRDFLEPRWARLAVIDEMRAKRSPAL